MYYRRLTAALPFIVVLLCVMTVNAQSGRRKTAPPPAAPVPTPTPEPTPVAKKENKEASLFFLVGADRSATMTIPFTYYSAVVRGCADRLRKGSSAEVDVSERDLGRGDAIKKAKEESKTYVVLISLQYDVMARTPDELVIDFVVFMPQTAKVLTTGRSYLNANRAGPLVVNRPAPLPGGMIREEWFRLAGEDVADRVLKKMNLNTVPTKY